MIEIEYLPKDFYNLNQHIIDQVNWLTHHQTGFLDIDPRRFIYRIRGKVYEKDSDELRSAISKVIMWKALNK